MTRRDKIIRRVLQGNADADIRFEDLINLLETLGFEMRIKGDHHILTRSGVDEILNLQPRSGKAKPYQVKQVRKVLTTYGLLATDADEECENE